MKFEDPWPVNYLNIAEWGILFLLMLFGLILGIMAIKHSLKVKSCQKPLSVKLLPCGAALMLILGLFCGIWDAIDVFAFFACESGTAEYSKTLLAMTSLALSQALYLPAYALLGSLGYLIFFIIALVILHSRQKPFFEK